MVDTENIKYTGQTKKYQDASDPHIRGGITKMSVLYITGGFGTSEANNPNRTSKYKKFDPLKQNFQLLIKRLSKLLQVEIENKNLLLLIIASLKLITAPVWAKVLESSNQHVRRNEVFLPFIY